MPAVALPAPLMQERTELEGFVMWVRAAGLERRQLLQTWRRNGLSVHARGSSRRWKSTDTPKQGDSTIQKCEMQGGVLPGLKPARSLVGSGLRDPKETLISVTTVALALAGLPKRSGCSLGSGRYRSCLKPSHRQTPLPPSRKGHF